jgi:hypothetical protein
MDMKKGNNWPATDSNMISIVCASLTIAPTSLHRSGIKNVHIKHIDEYLSPSLITDNRDLAGPNQLPHAPLGAAQVDSGLLEHIEPLGWGIGHPPPSLSPHLSVFCEACNYSVADSKVKRPQFGIWPTDPYPAWRSAFQQCFSRFRLLIVHLVSVVGKNKAPNHRAGVRLRVVFRQIPDGALLESLPILSGLPLDPTVCLLVLVEMRPISPHSLLPSLEGLFLVFS